ncbi:MAG: type II toxin-antitoxin system HicA family toxin [Chloroflexi bacterium]|nr:type II toxin-antitoxin system HicA family toxin [Chloroflexota bacterium]
MSYSREAWSQLKNLKCDDIIGALEKDGWRQDRQRGSARVYYHSSGRRVSIHYHPKKTYGRKLLKEVLDDIGWTEADLRRLKLIR